MLLCLKDACFKIEKIIAITRAQSVIPVSGYYDTDSDSAIGAIDNTAVTCNLLNIFLDGYATPISIIYNSVEERDDAYKFATKCFSDYFKR